MNPLPPRNAPPRPLPLHWYDREPNFGDALSPLLVSSVLGVPVVRASPLRCRICAVGSVLEHFFPPRLSWKMRAARCLAPPMLVWGAGFIQPPSPSPSFPFRRMDVLAVRGALSRDRLCSRLGLSPRGIPLGDPGLLCSRLLRGRHIGKTHDLGIVPHFLDLGNPLLSKIAVPNALLVDVRDPPMRVLERIASCRAILSSAMHGLIAADSLGIPNMRMVVGGGLLGGDYKFDDYYSAFGIPSPPKLVLAQTGKITDAGFVAGNAAVTPAMVEPVAAGLLRALRARFPDLPSPPLP